MILQILEYLFEENDDTLTYYHNKKMNIPIEENLLEFNKKRYFF